MLKNDLNIVIVENSSIIYEGLLSILSRLKDFQIKQANSLIELREINLRNQVDIALVNPKFTINNTKYFTNLKSEMNNTKWIALVYSLYDEQTISLFEGEISINDSSKSIIEFLRNLNFSETLDEQQKDALSIREIEVLKLLAHGNSNKEIADKLNISTHTVISHRKNISQKIGIKSLSGITIYAVANKIISLTD